MSKVGNLDGYVDLFFVSPTTTIYPLLAHHGRIPPCAFSYEYEYVVVKEITKKPFNRNMPFSLYSFNLTKLFFVPYHSTQIKGYVKITQNDDIYFKWLDIDPLKTICGLLSLLSPLWELLI